MLDCYQLGHSFQAHRVASEHISRKRRMTWPRNTAAIALVFALMHHYMVPFTWRFTYNLLENTGVCSFSKMTDEHVGKPSEVGGRNHHII